MKLLLLFCVVSQCAALWITQSDKKKPKRIAPSQVYKNRAHNPKTKIAEHNQIRHEVKKVDNTKMDNYGYVTMWISKMAIPRSVDMSKHILTGSERKKQWKNMMDEEVMHTSKSENQLTISESSPVRSLKEKFTEQLENEEGAASEMMNNYWEEEGGMGHTRKGIESVLHLAKRLVQVNAKHPLIVLTNEPQFIAISKNLTLKQMHPNLIVKEIRDDEWLNVSCNMNSNNLVHFQKLSVFGLVQYQKLLWLDLDVSLAQNIDFIFEKHELADGGSIVGQQDNWVRCDNHRNKFCSGMMLFQPSLKHFVGLQREARLMENCWGDQSIIESYFKDKTKGREIGLFDQQVVNFKRCLNKTAGQNLPMVTHHSNR